MQNNFLWIVSKTHIDNTGDIMVQLGRCWESKAQFFLFLDFFGEAFTFHFLKFFNPALDKGCFVLISLASLDEFLHLFDLELLGFEKLHLSSPMFCANLFKCLKVSLVVVQFFLLDVDNIRGHVVQKRFIVGNNNTRFFISFQVVFQPRDTGEIKVVCRFVKKQEVWSNKKGTCQCDTAPPSSGKIFSFFFAHLLGETETHDDVCGSGHSRLDSNILSSLFDSLQSLLRIKVQLGTILIL
mmetsp:Transcript_20045/g.49116  ORF Transcript_20045/g.49116 Transcript_20045/m.49116 type:complete len:240 (+) Transcript_20045:1447-2166(+)